MSWLMIDVGRSSSPEETLPLGRWSWMNKKAGWVTQEEQTSKQYYSSTSSDSSVAEGAQKVVRENKSSFLPKLL